MGARVKGMSRLRTDLGLLEDDIDDGAHEATESVAAALAERIEANVPVDTGDLRSSVEVEGSTVSVGDSRVDYAEFVEEDDPYVQPAVDEILRAGRKIATEAIRKELR